MNRRPEPSPRPPGPVQAPSPAPEPTLADLQAHMDHLRREQECGYVKDPDLRRLTDLIRQLSSKSPDPLLEFGFATVAGLLTQLLARLQLAVNDQLRQSVVTTSEIEIRWFIAAPWRHRRWSARRPGRTPSPSAGRRRVRT